MFSQFPPRLRGFNSFVKELVSKPEFAFKFRGVVVSPERRSLVSDPVLRSVALEFVATGKGARKEIAVVIIATPTNRENRHPDRVLTILRMVENI